jgi:deazaflavin-dependent oxidoreductase (nitroreductase family)
MIMAKQNNPLEGRLSRDREITITVTGRKSGRAISLPIWFVWDDGKLYLLPVKGSDTQWYKNVLKTPSIRINAGGAESQLKVLAVTDATQVKSVVEKFHHKYGTTGVNLYSKLDVALIAQTR